VLHWKLTSRGAEGTHVLLYGEITEATVFGELTQLRGHVLFDLAGVRRINSFGVRELISFMTDLGRGCQLEAERCSPVIVSQINMLPTLSSSIRIRSVLAPMECPKCFHETEIAVDIPRSGGRRPQIPRTECDECRTPMGLSEPEDRYFAFLEG
jgi:anti-anti-sigma regulatory factor